MLRVTDATFDKEVLGADLVLVDFWAPWCAPCRALNPILAKVEKQYKVVKIDIDECPALALRFNVSSIPTLLVFKKGKVVSQSVGMASEQAILRVMQSHTA